MADSADIVRRAPPLSPDRWRTLEPLIDQVLELPRERRAAFIADLRTRDASLADEVERFVAECDRPDPRLDDSAPARFAYLLDEVLPPPIPADTLLAGRYRIKHEIGRGGMAVVYLASDLKLHDRDVAVKVMRRGSLTTHAARRFLEEIRLTGTLRHPNIVPVYDADEFDEQAFFVMPHLEGETLRTRLQREPQHRLPISEALGVGVEIARALDYAHAHGVIHRDVKPSNLLLTSGVAMLADFGIARAETQLEHITEAGVTLGTPAYMSPEQADGSDKVEAQTDVYSLGCVLYEMISGVIPTPVARRVAEIQRGADPVRPLRLLRDEVSPRLEACIGAAMAVERKQRTKSAADLARALEACAHEYGVTVAPWKRLYWRRPRSVAVAAGVVIAAAVGGIWWAVRHPSSANVVSTQTTTVTQAGSSMDTTRIVILPFEHRGTTPLVGDEDDRLRDALRRWSGVDPVDRLETHNALAGRDTGRLTVTVRRDVGTALRAARYVIVTVTKDGDSTVLRGALYDARTGVALANAVVGVRRGRLDAAMNALADQLLFPDIPDSAVVRLRGATHSRPALQAYVRSQIAIAAWDLPRADAELTSATNYDQDFGLAYLWLAQVRSWRELAPANWQFAALRAVAARTVLGDRDRRVADALLATAALDSVRACDIWRGLTAGPRGDSDFAAWYAAARCDFHDRRVVRDPRSPSGWAFRTSYQHATQALTRAFEILPAIHREFRSSWYTNLKATLRTQPAQLRYGIPAPPDTGRFAAYPGWSASGDTLEFVPYPWSAFEQAQSGLASSGMRQAIQHQREVFLRIATTWRAAFLPSADALLAVAIALDDLGDPTAVDTVRAARRLAEDAGDAPADMRAGAAEVWMLVKRGLPNDLKRLTAARALADTLLRSDRIVDSTQMLAIASLAALTGHAHMAARFARTARSTEDLGPGVVPTAITPLIRALYAYAALGAPIDSIRSITGALRSSPMPNVNPGDRARWMLRAARVAFPSYHDTALRDMADVGDYLVVAEKAWLNHDTATIRQRLAQVQNVRRVTLPEELKSEVVYPEAWLLAAIGEPRAALEWVSPTLDAQSRAPTEYLRSVMVSGTLVRAMILRAELADQLGRPAEASQWARAVAALWQDADNELQPFVKAMERLAR